MHFISDFDLNLIGDISTDKFCFKWFTYVFHIFHSLSHRGVEAMRDLIVKVLYGIA